MAEVTFVIPVGPAHTALVDRAIASVNAQTVPADVVVVKDHHRRGPGWARNVGLAEVDTPYVSFLDADDWLEARFVERTLAASTSGRYVYTDWREGEAVKRAPDCAWNGASWHVLTTLIPTAIARRFAFDETLAGGEDSLYYTQMRLAGVCGTRVAEPLFHYSGDGTRAKSFMGTAAHHALDARIRGMKAMTQVPQGCCGPNYDAPDIPTDGLPGDVLAIAQWAGNRQQRGPVTGRLYPRGGNGRQMYVDPQDMAARPDLWAPAAPPAPTLFGAVEFGRALFPEAQLPIDLTPAAMPAGVKPDIEKIRAKGHRPPPDAELDPIVSVKVVE